MPSARDLVEPCPRLLIVVAIGVLCVIAALYGYVRLCRRDTIKHRR